MFPPPRFIWLTGCNSAIRYLVNIAFIEKIYVRYDRERTAQPYTSVTFCGSGALEVTETPEEIFKMCQ